MFSLTLEEDVKEISDECFKDINVVNVNLPKSIEKIGNNAFSEYCAINGIITLDAPEIVTEEFIKEFIQKIKGEKRIALAEGVREIRENSFRGTDIAEIVIPKSIKVIGNRAFGECKNLTSVIL